MIRIIKKILFFVLILFSFFLVSKVQANTLNKIDMDIYIDENGNASVTEVWQVNLTEGSEGFRSITNLGNSSISNFSVSDDFGRTYDTLSNWNTGATFENKAYKCGIHTIPSGVELCWGISNYGNRTYTLNYTINNLVTQYTDTQGIYFNFLNLDQEISDNTKIVIHSNIPFSFDNAKIWSFGNNGSINFDNGNIVIDSGGRLLANQYIVGLIKFESNLFNTNSNSSISFDDIYNSAFGINDNESEFNWISLLGYILLFILIALLLGVIIYLVIVIGTPLFILVMAIFSMSTTAYIGMALGCISLFWGKQKYRIHVLIGAAMLGCTILIVGPYKFVKETVFFDKETISLHETSGRDKIMNVAVDALLQKPEGYGFFAGEPYLLYAKRLSAINGHNSLFSAAIGLGIPGIVLISIFFLGMFRIVLSRHIYTEY